MKKKFRKAAAILLSAVIMCGGTSFSALADVQQQSTMGGLVKEDGKWCYIDENGVKAKNTLKVIDADHSYYFDQDGYMIKPERGDNLDAAFELMEINGELYFIEFTGNVYSEWGWLFAKDGRTPDDEQSYWFYKKADNTLLKNGISTINQKKYAFDEMGHMMSDQIISTEEGNFYALNTANGSLARDRWLLIDGEWYYFNSDGLMPNEPTNGCPYSEIETVRLQAPENLEVEVGKTVKLPVSFTVATDSNAQIPLPDDETELLVEEDEIEDPDIIDTDLEYLDDLEELASPSNAYYEEEDEEEEIETASPSDADKKTDEKTEQKAVSRAMEKAAKTTVQSRKLQRMTESDNENVYSGKKAGEALSHAYNYGMNIICTREDGSIGSSGASFDISDGAVRFTSSFPCHIEISFEIDGVESDSIEFDCVRKKDTTQKDTENAISKIIGQQSRIVVDELRALNKENLSNIFRNNADLVRQISQVEKDYALEYNIGMENSIEPELLREFDAGKIGTIGAAMNADADSDVVFRVGKSVEHIDMSAVAKAKKYQLDLSLAINNEAISELDIPMVISMPIPESIQPESLDIYHYHNGQQKKLDISINAADRIVTFTTDKFSTFLFAGNPKSSGSSGGSYSSRSASVKKDPLETSGTWIQDEIGWWFKKTDGTYPVSQWVMNGGLWFRFDEKGYMMTGWYTDVDGKKYYLNPVSDGSRGSMKLGWQQIDQKWYYFNLVSDGTKGALLVNTTTPDGYQVNADGVWVQ